MNVRPLVAALVLLGCQASQSSAPPPPATPDARVAVTPMKRAAVDTPAVREVAAPWTLTASDGSGLVLTRVDAKAVVQGPLAYTELHLYFRNPENRTREGTFAITLPSGAAVSRFGMEINGQMQEAEVVAKATARRIYDDFLHRKQDPALLEKGAGNQFTAKVFPIPPRSDKHLVVSFSQELAGRGYALPLRGLPTTARIDVQLAATGLDGSPHTQTLSERDWQPDRDFIAAVPATAAAVTSGALVVGALAFADSRGTFAAPEPPSKLTLLVDTSASRALGFARYVTSIRELVAALRAQYGDPLELQVVAFDQDTEAIFDGVAADYSTEHDRALIARGAAGASNLGQAIAAMGAPHPRMVVVTDGVMTAGPDTPALVAAIRELPIDRLDVVLAGGIRDERLAASLVRAGVLRAGDVHDLDRGIATVVAGLGEPVAVDVSIDVPGATWVYPRSLPAARPGSTLMVYARMARPTKSIEIVVGGRTRTIGLGTATPALIERAIAGAEIEELENVLASATEPAASQKLRADITQRSVRSRVISSQTAMLVLETEADYARYQIDRRSLSDIVVVGPTGLEQTRRSAVLASGESQQGRMSLDEGMAGKRDIDPPSDESALEDRGNPKLAREAAIEQARSAGLLGSSGSGGVASLESTADFSTGFDDTNVHGMLFGTEGGEDNGGFGFGRSGFGPSGGGRASAGPSASVRFSRGQPRPAPEPARKQHAPLTGKLADVMAALRGGTTAMALGIARAWHAEAPGDVLALIALGEALEATEDPVGAARIYGSIIDLYPTRADFRRFAGERLERLGGGARELTIDTYRRAVADRPDHVSGHRLLAYALVRHGDHAGAFAAILAGIDQRYPAGRFAGAERVLREDAGMIAAVLVASGGTREAVMAELTLRSIRLAEKPSTRFVMYWETDSNDVDFHIRDSQGGHAFYSSRTLPSGGELYADVTTGYGPECFAIPGTPTAGPYQLSINYFSQGPMGYGMGLLQIQTFDGKAMTFEDRPFVIMRDHAFVDLGSFK